MRSTARLGLAMAALVLGGCDSHEHAADDAGTAVVCAAETRADTYRAGMGKNGSVGAVMLHLMEAVPAPPAKGENAWTMELMDHVGDMIDGATLTVTPYMPDHAHGTTVKAEVTGRGGGGYRVAPIDLFLEGYWTITFDVQAPGNVSDQVVFAFCVES